MSGDSTRLRLGILGVVVLSLFSALLARLWYLQVLAAPTYQVEAQHNSVRFVYTEAPRGRILDRNGKVLVDNRVVPTVVVDRAELGEKPEVVVDRLLGPGRRSRSTKLQERIDDHRFSPFKPVPVADDVPKEMLIYIREHQAEFPGVAGGAADRAGLPATAPSPPTSSATWARSTTTELDAPQEPRATGRATASASRASSWPTRTTCGASPRSRSSRSTPRAGCCARWASSRRCRATTSASPSTSTSSGWPRSPWRRRLDAAQATYDNERQALPRPRRVGRGARPPRRQRPGHGVVPHLRPRRVRRRDQREGLRRPPGPGRPLPAQQPGHPGPLRPGVDVQAGHVDRRPGDGPHHAPVHGERPGHVHRRRPARRS